MARACRSDFEARDHLLGVHAELDDLQRHAPPNRFLLLRHVNDTEATLTDLLEQFVRADDGAFCFSFAVVGGCLDRRLKGHGLEMLVQQHLQARTEICVPTTGSVQESRALRC